MSDQGRTVPDHAVHHDSITRDTHVMIPRWVIILVCTCFLGAVGGLITTGVWMDQQNVTRKTAANNTAGITANSGSIERLAKRMTINEQVDKAQDAELSRLSMQVDSISSQQGVNSQHLAAIESLLQQLNDRLKEISSRMDARSYGQNSPPKTKPRNHDVADYRRVRPWNQ